MTFFRQRSMMNSLWEIITNVLLVQLHCLRSTIVHRVKKRWMMLNHPRMLVNSRKKRKIITRRTDPKTKVRGKERNSSSATTVVVLIILQRSAKSPTLGQLVPEIHQRGWKNKMIVWSSFQRCIRWGYNFGQAPWWSWKAKSNERWLHWRREHDHWV